MAIILFKCPYCGKKVETSEDNVGREGLCPGCQKIFEIPKPTEKQTARATRAAPAGMLGGGPPEYGELPVLVGVAIVGLALLGLAATSVLLGWTHPGGSAAQVVAQQKVNVLIGALVCLVFLVISAVTRKSLMPATLVGAAWGMFALIWVGSIWRTMGDLIKESDSRAAALAPGAYLAMAAGLLAIAGGVFVYYQVRDGAALEKAGFFLVATQVIALAVALILSGRTLKPALLAAPPAVQAPTKAAAPKTNPPAPRQQQPQQTEQPAEEPPAE